MARDRSTLGPPLGVDGPWLAAIVGALDDLHDLLDERLPRRAEEPAPAALPGRAVPVTEPAPVVAPDGDADEPALVSEPAPLRPPLPDPPPRAGRGSSAEAWRAWAELAGVTVPEAATRDDIIAACEQAGALEGKQ